MNYRPAIFPNVASPSGERVAMQADLDLIADIRGGLPRIKARASVYLPRYDQESGEEWQRRRDTAPWRPEFIDGLNALASKPFAKPVSLPDSTPDQIKRLAEDIDGAGNALHVFARDAFMEGLANGIHAIYVTYPAGHYRTVAEFEAASPRPYWVQVPIGQIISVEFAHEHGREVVKHLRLSETSVERDGWGEKTVNRVRVIEPTRWQLWKLDPASGAYDLESEGQIEMGAGPEEVPIVFYRTGMRIGQLLVRPPLRDLADMQIELYRALSRRDEILTFAGSPMLGTSMKMPEDNGPNPQISVGPKTVLFGTGGERANVPWAYVSPAADCIREVRESVHDVIADMRRLAMSPMITRSGDVTATESAVTAAKAHSQLQAWAIGLKDALERAFTFTERWIGETNATTVSVHTDFGVGVQDVEQARILGDAQKRQVISKRTERAELKRRNILSAEFADEVEDEQIAIEVQGLEPEDDFDPRSGSILPFASAGSRD